MSPEKPGRENIFISSECFSPFHSDISHTVHDVIHVPFSWPWPYFWVRSNWKLYFLEASVPGMSRFVWLWQKQAPSLCYLFKGDEWRIYQRAMGHYHYKKCWVCMSIDISLLQCIKENIHAHGMRYGAESIHNVQEDCNNRGLWNSASW